MMRAVFCLGWILGIIKIVVSYEICSVFYSVSERSWIWYTCRVHTQCKSYDFLIDLPNRIYI
jgi:hypothetical protein